MVPVAFFIRNPHMVVGLGFDTKISGLWSDRWDLNPRPLASKTSTLNRCATACWCSVIFLLLADLPSKALPSQLWDIRAAVLLYTKTPLVGFLGREPRFAALVC
jgi:hypothetical protein